MMEIMLPRKERRKLERRLNKAKQGGKMKKIRYESEFLTADGQPFSITNPDVHALKEAREKARVEGKERFELPTIECDFAQAMVWFVNNIPFEKNDKGEPARKLTHEDAGNAYAVIKAFKDTQNGYVELEESVYKWLVEVNKTDGVEAFRVTQAVVAERLEDTIKEGKPDDK